MFVIEIYIPKGECHDMFEEMKNMVSFFLSVDLDMDSLIMDTYNAAEMCKDLLMEMFPGVKVHIKQLEAFRARG